MRSQYVTGEKEFSWIIQTQKQTTTMSMSQAAEPLGRGDCRSNVQLTQKGGKSSPGKVSAYVPRRENRESKPKGSVPPGARRSGLETHILPAIVLKQCSRQEFLLCFIESSPWQRDKAYRPSKIILSVNHTIQKTTKDTI